MSVPGFAFKGLFKRTVQLAVAGALSASLSACFLSPGMTMSERSPVSPDDPNSYPDVIPITQNLIATELSESARNSPSDEAIDALIGKPAPYRVAPADVLSVIVWEHPELVLPNVTYDIGATKGSTNIPYVGSTPAVGYSVSEDGYIQFPYIGLIKVAGLTETRIQRLLTRRLAAYVNRPQLTVRIIGFNSQHVYVDGAVATTGALPITTVPMTLGLALNSSAGLPTTTGDRSRVFLMRNGQRYRIDLTRLAARGISPAQIPLVNGDTIHVEPLGSNKVTVAGEVLRPITVPLRSNGRLTLSEALGEAGSINPSSSKPESIYVLRAAEDGSSPPRIFHLDSKSASALTLAQQFPLRAKDVVYVDTAGLVRWNRVISLLTGSANIVYTGQRINDN